MSSTLAQLGVTPERLTAYDQRIPRYTSYPTAPFWTPEFGAKAWTNHLQAHRDSPKALSLYVHIPFCAHRCFFCGCNVIISQKPGIASDYLDTLAVEISRFREHYDAKGEVIQLHLGGGTPNYLASTEMQRLLNLLSEHFIFADGAERSLEVDPRVASPDDIHRLKEDHGFNRISFGVQDFNPATQKAVGRTQTLDCTFANVEAAREVGFSSINIDLIYGLPLQNLETWTASLDHVLRLRPDRIALYNFAYLPSLMKNQTPLKAEQLPSPEEKLKMFVEAHDRLTAGGWRFIGMDHYALEEDSLSQAQIEGTLRRNFMGYTTLRGTDLISFGVSSISEVQGAFSQNLKGLKDYRGALGNGSLPVERGCLLSAEDRLRQYLIEELMCNGRLRYEGDLPLPGELIQKRVEAVRSRLEYLAQDGLLHLDDQGLTITPKGRIFLRNIAVVFDAYLENPGDHPTFSRAV